MTQGGLEELENPSTTDDMMVKLEELVRRESDEVSASKANATFVEETLKSLRAGSGSQGDENEARGECPLCLDMMEIPVLVPPCMHKWYANGLALANLGY